MSGPEIIVRAMECDAMLELLVGQTVRRSQDAATVERFVDFVRRRPDCLLRSCREGHVTGSGWVVGPDGRVVLVHHRKLDRWVQPGGHADGEARVHRVALREVFEETGLSDLTLVDECPFDLDIHAIPAHEGVARHLHYDLRYLVRAGPGDLRVSEESHDVRWFTVKEVFALGDESLSRMARRDRENPGATCRTPDG